LEILKKRFECLGSKISQYKICREKHENGNPHFHALLILENKIERRGSRLLDIVIDENRNHPKIEGLKSLSAALKYIEKDGDFITNIEE